MKDWLVLGLSEDLFWRSTLRQVDLHFAAAAERARREHNDRAWLAWNIYAIPLMRPRPKLHDLQIREPGSRHQTPEDRLRMAKQIAAMARQ